MKNKNLSKPVLQARQLYILDPIISYSLIYDKKKSLLKKVPFHKKFHYTIFGGTKCFLAPKSEGEKIEKNMKIISVS